MVSTTRPRVGAKKIVTGKVVGLEKVKPLKQVLSLIQQQGLQFIYVNLLILTNILRYFYENIKKTQIQGQLCYGQLLKLCNVLIQKIQDFKLQKLFYMLYEISNKILKNISKSQNLLPKYTQMEHFIKIYKVYLTTPSILKHRKQLIKLDSDLVTLDQAFRKISPLDSHKHVQDIMHFLQSEWLASQDNPNKDYQARKKARYDLFRQQIQVYNGLGLRGLKYCFQGHNIFDHMERAASCGKISEMSENKDKFIMYLTALLNSAGGFIMFGCLQQFGDIIPEGQEIIKSQQQLQSLLDIYLGQIQPKPLWDQNLRLSFVRVLPLRSQSIFNTHQERKLVKIEVLEDHIFYRYKQGQLGDEFAYPACSQHMLVCKQSIAKKSQSELNQLMSDMQIRQEYFRNEFWPISKESEIQNGENSQTYQQQLQIARKVVKERSIHTSLQEIETNQTIILSPQIQNQRHIKDHFEDRFEGNHANVSNHFENNQDLHNQIRRARRRFMLSSKFCLIISDRFYQHQIEHMLKVSYAPCQWIQRNIDQQYCLYELQFQGSFDQVKKGLEQIETVQVIRVEKYLRLVNRSQYQMLTSAQLVSLKLRLKQSFPSQNIRLYVYKQLEQHLAQQIYIGTTSLQSLFQLYFILNTQGQLACFANPKRLQNLRCLG